MNFGIAYFYFQLSCAPPLWIIVTCHGCPVVATGQPWYAIIIQDGDAHDIWMWKLAILEFFLPATFGFLKIF